MNKSLNAPRAPSLIPPPPYLFRQPSDRPRPRSTVGGSFPLRNGPMVSVQEMGGFPVVLPPRVTLSTVAEPPLPKLPVHKSGGPWNRKPPPGDFTLPCHPPCHVIHCTGSHMYASCWRHRQKGHERRNHDLGSPELVSEVVFDVHR